MGFSSPSRERTGPTLPLAPMVDILFLLLVFFLWTAAQREEGSDIPIEVQQVEGGEERRAVDPIFITITQEDEIFIGARSYTLDSARDALSALGAPMLGESQAQRLARLQRTPIILRGDRTSNLGTTMEIIGFARAAGLTNVRMEGKKK